MDELAAEHGFTYEVAKADIDEKAIRHPDPHTLVLRLAHAKAAAVIAKLEAAGGGGSGLLVTCDQVVLHEGLILEKPEDAEEVREGHLAGGLGGWMRPGPVAFPSTPAQSAAPCAAQARRYIRGYGRAHASTIGSVVCTDLATGRVAEGVDVAEVRGGAGVDLFLVSHDQLFRLGARV